MGPLPLEAFRLTPTARALLGRCHSVMARLVRAIILTRAQKRRKGNDNHPRFARTLRSPHGTPRAGHLIPARSVSDAPDKACLCEGEGQAITLSYVEIWRF